MASDFRMPIMRIEAVPGGSGAIAHGRVEAGGVMVGDDVQVLGADGPLLTAMVAGVAVGGKLLDVAKTGQSAQVVLRRVDPAAIPAGAVLVGL